MVNLNKLSPTINKLGGLLQFTNASQDFMYKS